MLIPKHSENYTIRAYAVDTQKQILIPTLITLMHETAMQHVLKIKLSVWDLEPLHLAWVLTQIKVKIHRLPLLGEEIEIVTHPSAFERVRTFRDYRVYDKEGNLLASAVSQWFLMNTHSRRLARVPQEIKDVIQACLDQLEDFLDRDAEKLPPFEKVDFRRNFQVGYHDLDFNAHLNNIYYAKWMLDALPYDFLQQHRLDSLTLNYKLESTINEKLSAESQQLNDQQYLHRLVKEGKEIASAKSVWLPKNKS